MKKKLDMDSTLREEKDRCWDNIERIANFESSI